MDARDEVVLTLTDNHSNRNRSCPHKPAVIFHLLFRTAAILTYLFCGLFNIGFIISFISIVLLCSLDFWVVKNISGRQLVQLRWWNYVDDQGKNKWVFESRQASKNQQSTQNHLSSSGESFPLESRVFWLSLVAFQVLWALLFLASVFTLHFHWLTVVVVASFMNAANLYGYIRCKLGGNNDSIKTAGSNLIVNNVLTRFLWRNRDTK